MVFSSMVISGALGMAPILPRVRSEIRPTLPAMPAPTHRAASEALAQLDPVMAELVRRHGPMTAPPRVAVADRFENLAEAIAYQQLAGRAAATIWGRVRALYDGGPLDPGTVLATPEADLRGAGLSAAKAAAILDLAAHAADGRLELHRMGRLSDEAVIDELVAVRGIGRWTAQMFLIFALGRLDVWPTGDLGVRTGWGVAHGLPEPPSPKELEQAAESLRPYRSVVAWYCWRAVDAPGLTG
jgi:3-methyladenine DNA glycosylase/8-oxoguanine DNA glycosylase